MFLIMAKTDIPSLMGGVMFTKGMVYDVNPYDQEDDHAVSYPYFVMTNQGVRIKMSKDYLLNNFMQVEENLIIMHGQREGIIIKVNPEDAMLYFPDKEETLIFTHDQLLKMRHKTSEDDDDQADS